MGLAYLDATALVDQPGPFQGEEPWVPLAYEHLLDGRLKETDFVDGAWLASMEVTGDDRTWWHLKPGTVALSLTISNDGFVSGAEMTEQDYAELQKEIQEDQENRDDNDDKNDNAS